MTGSTRPIRVCFLSLHSYALFNPSRSQQLGGAEVDAYLIGTALASDDHYNVSFVTADFGQPGIEQFGNITVIKSYPLGKKGWRRFWYHLMAIPILFHTLRRARAHVYFQEGAGIETGLVRIFTWVYGAKFLHRTASINDCNGGYRRQFPFRGWWAEFGLRHADYIVTETNEQSLLLERRWGVHSKTIYDTTPLFDPMVEPITRRKNIVWVGRLVQIKRPDIFIKLAKDMPDQQFVLVGLPEATEQTLLQHTREQAKKTANLAFIEGLPYHEINAIYSEATALVNTSDYEGFPNVFLESAVFGVPIFSLNIDPDGCISRHKIGGFANGDISMLQKLIRNMINDPSQHQLSSENIKKYVALYHDIHNNIQEYKRIIDQLAAAD